MINKSHLNTLLASFSLAILFSSPSFASDGDPSKDMEATATASPSLSQDEKATLESRIGEIKT